MGAAQWMKTWAKAWLCHQRADDPGEWPAHLQASVLLVQAMGISHSSLPDHNKLQEDEKLTNNFTELYCFKASNLDIVLNWVQEHVKTT